ncbi:hypothetical protein ABIB82_007885 [Bradyrhizobium sp. i1.8.4]
MNRFAKPYRRGRLASRGRMDTHSPLAALS